MLWLRLRWLYIIGTYAENLYELISWYWLNPQTSLSFFGYVLTYSTSSYPRINPNLLCVGWGRKQGKQAKLTGKNYPIPVWCMWSFTIFVNYRRMEKEKIKKTSDILYGFEPLVYVTILKNSEIIPKVKYEIYPYNMSPSFVN